MSCGSLAREVLAEWVVQEAPVALGRSARMDRGAKIPKLVQIPRGADRLPLYN